MKKLLILIAILVLPNFCLNAEEAGFPVKYPKETYSMNKQEFYNWAIKQNKQAETYWFNISEPEYLYYNKNITNIIGNLPSLISTSTKKGNTTIIRQTLPYRYKNPDYVSPGPLTIINPYVHPATIKGN